jgi:hypothetical protein
MKNIVDVYRFTVTFNKHCPARPLDSFARILRIIWAIRSKYIFQTVTNINMKDDKSKVFVGNNGGNISATRGAPIAIEEKWRIKCKRLG